MRDDDRRDTAVGGRDGSDDEYRSESDSGRRSERGAGESGPTRRRYLGASAVVLTAATAGCPGILGGGDGESGDSPESVVRAYIDAVNEGDAETANDLLHPDGTGTELTEEEAQQLAEVEFTVESLEVLEQSDERADVEMTSTMAFGGEENTQTTMVELRTHEGEWKLYSGDVSA